VGDIERLPVLQLPCLLRHLPPPCLLEYFHVGTGLPDLISSDPRINDSTGRCILSLDTRLQTVTEGNRINIKA
jgi:hypothetical protein